MAGCVGRNTTWMCVCGRERDCAREIAKEIARERERMRECVVCERVNGRMCRCVGWKATCVRVCACVCVCVCERMRDRQIDRDKERERQRERATRRERTTQRERERERARESGGEWRDVSGGMPPGHLMLWSSALQDTHWFGHRPHTCCDGFGHICCARACGIIASASQTTNMPLPRACAVVGRCLQGGLPCARHPVHLHGCVCQASCWSPSIVRHASPSLPAGSDISPHPAASPAHRQFAEFGRTPAPSASAAIWAAQRDWSSSWISVTSSRRGVRMMR